MAGVIRVRIINVPTAMVPHHGRPVVTWMYSRPDCSRPIGVGPPKPRAENDNSPRSFRLAGISSTDGVGVGAGDGTVSAGASTHTSLAGAAFAASWAIGEMLNLRKGTRPVDNTLKGDIA